MKTPSLLPRFLRLLPAVLALASGAAIAAAPRPNIVVIFTDDQGYEDLGCFGSKTIKTPHIDRMAAEGLRLTSFYAQPVCGVSRAALMTGSYPIRVGEPGNVKRLHTVPHPEELTMAEVLKGAGYATAIIGKWHQTERNPALPGRFDPATMPNAQGFDYFYGTPEFNGTTVRVAESPFRSPIFRNGDVVVPRVESWDNITGDYTREAVAWIRRQRDRPFFLYLAHTMPHIPVGASPAFKGKSAGGPFGDTIEEIDWSTGEILKTLRDLGLDGNTLVVFTSDNGPWIETTRGMKPGAPALIAREHSGNAGPLRGWKMSAWEGGSRVPFVARWPGKIPAGRTSGEILSTLDLLPTFAALAGAALPATLRIDGRDAGDFLLGRSERSPRDEYLYYTGCLLTGIRQNRWKLVLPRPANPPGTGWWGRMIEAIPAAQLYDLAADPGETTDVAARHPEVVAALQTRLAAAREELGDIGVTGRGARFFDAGPRRLQVPVAAAAKP
jgi:arylsulfatase